jgi:hypothetical protein
MKKNLMSLAVAAGVAGITASAQAAMYVNPEGTGQVLLFPYYNAENGNETSMHIVNTTKQAKAVKVRFMEYVNSQEVLDFNLYLSAEDHFSFTIFKNPNGDGGAIVTRDNSCTVPALGDANAGIPGSTTTNADGSITRIQPFLNYQYDDDKYKGIYRSNIGHVEVIEMGELNNSGTKLYKSWATHGATGVPANCAKLVTAWSTGGSWKADATDGITAATGGLYGLSNQLNAADAAAFGVEPAAIANFWPANQFNHSDPGSVLPSLASGDLSSLVPNAGSYYQLGFSTGRKVDAVSSLFMSKAVMNDVMINPDLNGLTDWVITFPTRRYYVNSAVAIAPFTDKYDGTKDPDNACEEISINQWDREEAFIDVTETPVFSPKPDTPAAAKNYLCYETNTIAAGSDTSALNATMSTATNKAAAVKLAFPYTEGWQKISFLNAKHKITPASVGGVTNTTSATIDGLPAIGFGAFKYVNGASSFGFVSDHKTEVAGSAIGG